MPSTCVVGGCTGNKTKNPDISLWLSSVIYRYLKPMLWSHSVRPWMMAMHWHVHVQSYNLNQSWLSFYSSSSVFFKLVAAVDKYFGQS